jgi:predicted permease
MRIPLRAGRYFTSRDTAESDEVMIVNETMARRLWPGRDAVGQIALLGGDREWRVVGVVGDVRHSALEEAASMEMYLPIPKIGASSVDLVVRGKMPLTALVSSVRSALKQIDPTLPTAEFQTLGQIIDRAVSPKRLITLLLGGFSWLALVLASLGIYGVISYSVSQRTQEIGIRLALGAPNAAVLKLVIGQGMKLAMIGVAIGLIASLGLMRVMKSLLFGVSTTDPLTFLANALLLSAVALLACYLPARRASRVDPMEALRCE